MGIITRVLAFQNHSIRRFNVFDDGVQIGHDDESLQLDPADQLRAKIPVALAANNAFLGLASPSNAQVLAQVQRLTRQVNVLGRLVGQLLDDTSDT